MNTKVVPDPSERRTTAIGCDGSFAPGLSLRSAAWFHDLISPRKMRARVGPSSVMSPLLMPSTFTTATMPPTTVGNCTSPCSSRSAALSGMSDAPKVTSLSWICLMPSLDPTGR